MNIDLEMSLIKKDIYPNKDKELMVCLNLVQQTDNKREILINKFIEKFPKVKLHTIIKVNKYYNEYCELNSK